MQMFGNEITASAKGARYLRTALRRSAGPFPAKQFDVMPEVIETRRHGGVR